LDSIGYPAFSHSFQPPFRAETSLKPMVIN
jgi:hypothetical protein